MKEKIMTITLEESDLIALLHATAHRSCGYDKNTIENNLWHLHCCDYNEPIYKVVKQIDLSEVADDDHKEWVKRILGASKEYYEVEE